MKNNYKKISIWGGGIGVLIGFPLICEIIIQFLYDSLPGKAIGEVTDWISFSGGYVGSILTIAGVYYQISKEEKNRKQDTLMEKIDKEMGALKYFEYVFEDTLLYMENAKKQAVLSTLFNINDCFSDEKYSLFSINKEIYTEMFLKISDKQYGVELIKIREAIDSADDIVIRNLKLLKEKNSIVEKINEIPELSI